MVDKKNEAFAVDESFKESFDKTDNVYERLLDA